MRHLRISGFSLRYHPRAVALGLCLILALFLLGILHLASGTIRYDLLEIWQGLAGGSDNPRSALVLQNIRLPRLLTALMVGLALGASGAVFQSLSRNPLGSPDIIGLTTGAASGALLQIILFNAGEWQTGLAALGTGIATALVILVLARPKHSGADQRMILMGIGIGAGLSGLNTLLMVMGNIDSAMSGQIWLAGSLAGRHWGHVGLVAAGLLLCLPVVMLLRRALEISEMGEDMARALGVSPPILRISVVLAGVGLAAAATAAAGPIAFIAFAGPQIAKKLARGSQLSPLLAGLCGALLLLAADLLSLNTMRGWSMPIGLTTALLGGAWILLYLRRRAPQRLG